MHHVTYFTQSRTRRGVEMFFHIFTPSTSPIPVTIDVLLLAVLFVLFLFFVVICCLCLAFFSTLSEIFQAVRYEQLCPNLCVHTGSDDLKLVWNLGKLGKK